MTRHVGKDLHLQQQEGVLEIVTPQVYEGTCLYNKDQLEKCLIVTQLHSALLCYLAVSQIAPLLTESV
jgi:hypothetical protein